MGLSIVKADRYGFLQLRQIESEYFTTAEALYPQIIAVDGWNS